MIFRKFICSAVGAGHARDEDATVTLVPKLQLGNPDDEASASRDGKLELPALNSQAGAWELAAIRLFSFPRAAWECGQGALRRESRRLYGTQRVQHCIPTQRVGMRAKITSAYGSHALRGNHNSGGTADHIFTSINPVIGLLLLTLAGCTHQDQDRQLPRPVNVVRIADQTAQNNRPFPGEVKARYETSLAFRVAGKLINRSVDVGEQVHKGQVLAKLDPSDYRFVEQNFKAQLIAAKADRKYTQEDLSRYRELFDQHIISQPELDRHQTLYINAQQNVAALEAQLGQTGNQLAYTDLLADRDGVVTALEVETGQVVALGQPVIKLARLDEKEIAIDIPEHRIAGIKLQQEVGVTLWVDGDKRIKARIREIAAAADPVSRTYRVKATVLEDRDDVRLGMTATVWISSSTPAKLTVPLSAVFTSQNQPGQTSVWLVDERSSTVKAVPVKVGDIRSGERVAATGLAAGQLIVSAGANRLIEGQTVRLPQTLTQEIAEETRR
ncbi:MAG: efflux RND transporter periplasmic adaptor subunit [Methylobacter sp.]